jgi:hypothetical protein
MTIRACLLASLAAVAACGGDGNKDVDAMIVILPDTAPDAAPDAFEPTFDFACMGNAAPTTATANVTLSGFAAEIVVNLTTPMIQAAHNATIEVCKASSTTCANADKLNTKTTPMNGCPAMGCPFTTDALVTGSQPLDIYVKASKAGNRTTHIYPPSPVTMDFPMIPAAMFASTAFQALITFGVVQHTSPNGNLIVAVADCANMPISDTANVTVSVKQNGTAVQGTQTIDASQFAPQLAGTFLIFNVPPGVTEIGATYKTKTLRAHNVRVFPDASTASAIRPGY